MDHILKTSRVIVIFVLIFLLNSCSSEPQENKSDSNLESLFGMLYQDLSSVYEGTFERYKIEGKDENAALQLSSIDKLKSFQSHFVKMSEAAQAADIEEGSTNKDLQALANMFERFISESEEYLQIAENYDELCADGEAEPWTPSLGNGSDSNRLCNTVWNTIIYLEQAPITCIYLGASRLLEKYPNFDVSKMTLLNSTSKSVADQACSIMPNAYSILGFPKIQYVLGIPERIRQSSETEYVLEIAGGLYTDYISDSPILNQVVNGSWYGYCSVFKDLEAKLASGFKTGECY
jgi:hypothetical protein